MKYEDILKWRQEVYECTVLAAQLARRKVQSEELNTTNPASVARGAWTNPNGQLAQQLAVPPKLTTRDIDEEWPALSAASVATEKRKSLPLPGGHSPAETNNIHDLTLRRVPRHDEFSYAFGWMANSPRNAGATDRVPTPVPVSLAPAQGHTTPKILKRPVSGSFSLYQGPPKSAMFSVTEDASLRTRSTTQSTIEPSDASVAGATQYALALAPESALMGQALSEEEEGPVTPAKDLVNEAIPRVLMNDNALTSGAELGGDRNSIQPMRVLNRL